MSHGNYASNISFLLIDWASGANMEIFQPGKGWLF